MLATISLPLAIPSSATSGEERLAVRSCETGYSSLADIREHPCARIPSKSSLRLGANRTNVPKVNDNYVSWSSLGANISPLADKMIGLNLTGTGVAFGAGNASPGAQHDGPLWSVVDDVSWIKGSHQFGFGGSIYQQRLNYWSGTNAVGVASFDGSSTGATLADFVVGNMSAFSQGTNYGFYTPQYYVALYAQDSWKINRRLTLNYGVRWEPYLAPYNNRARISISIRTCSLRISAVRCSPARQQV